MSVLLCVFLSVSLFLECKNLRKYWKLQEASRSIRGSPYVNCLFTSIIIIHKLVQSSFKTPKCLNTNNIESVPLINYPIWKLVPSYSSPKPKFFQLEPVISVSTSALCVHLCFYPSLCLSFFPSVPTPASLHCWRHEAVWRKPGSSRVQCNMASWFSNNSQVHLPLRCWMVM